MIYVFPPEDKPIRQGDIFARIPRVRVPLTKLQIINRGEVQDCPWDLISKEGSPVNAILQVAPVYAIVATQNCDALTSPEITLCEIREFRTVEGKAKDTNTAKGWQRIITQHARLNQKWFYLPPDTKIGFTNKMGVDFRCTLRVCRTDLENFRSFRKGTLNALARQHFRERLGQFFRRYPYNEWYPLNHEELKEYEKDHNCVVSPKYSWQANK